ncbi:Uncharacterised protein [Mycobacteroides abscessus subsp. abscessus]|nr:Uncharacterised protein [Mycobacteroides abscessus subsp. abscessus]
MRALVPDGTRMSVPGRNWMGAASTGAGAAAAGSTCAVSGCGVGRDDVSGAGATGAGAAVDGAVDGDAVVVGAALGEVVGMLFGSPGPLKSCPTRGSGPAAASM